MYNEIDARLLAIVEPVVRDHGLEVVDVAVHSGGGRVRVQIVVDTPEGDGRVPVDDLAGASREVGHGLDAADYFTGAYVLEVCSPGIDRVLGRPLDFARAVGREVRLETREPIDGRRRFRGRLGAFDGERARIDLEAGSFMIPLGAVARARAVQDGAEAAGHRSSS